MSYLVLGHVVVHITHCFGQGQSFPGFQTLLLSMKGTFYVLELKPQVGAFELLHTLSPILECVM